MSVAEHRFARIAAQKCRLVADQVRGLSVGHAMNLLAHSEKKAAVIVRKVLESALANAENNDGLDVDSLAVGRIEVQEGPRARRMSARAKGRANRILKRTCHVRIALKSNFSF